MSLSEKARFSSRWLWALSSYWKSDNLGYSGFYEISDRIQWKRYNNENEMAIIIIDQNIAKNYSFPSKRMLRSNDLKLWLTHDLYFKKRKSPAYI